MKNNVMENPQDQILSNDKQLYYCRFPVSKFLAENNPALKSRRTGDITPWLLKIWISRYITRDKSTDIKWFGLSVENDEYVVWFEFESEAQKCQILFEEIAEKGFPSRFKWIPSY